MVFRKDLYLFVAILLLLSFAYGDTSPVFTDESEARLSADPTCGREIEAADFDKDGDIDVLIAVAGPTSNDSGNLLLVNDGSGFFTAAGEGIYPAGDDSSRGMDTGDLNGDGNLDIVVANRMQQDRIIFRMSEGGFVDMTEEVIPIANHTCSRDVEIGDVDDDGDLDIHITQSTTRSDYLLFNNGEGEFSNYMYYRFPYGLNDSFDSEMEDIDRDGDLDLVTVMLGNEYERTIPKILINSGGALFEDRSKDLFDGPEIAGMDCEIADFNFDGNPDLFVAVSTAYGDQDRLLINDGTGRFVDETDIRLPILFDSSGSCTSGDIDGDGDLDIITGLIFGSVKLRCFENDGTGHFKEASADLFPPINIAIKDILLLDIDGDGDLDLMGATWDGDGNAELDLVLVNSGVPDTIPPVILYTIPHPATSADYRDYPVTTAIQDNVSNNCFGNILYENGDTLESEPMQHIGGHLLRGFLPIAEQGSEIRYRIEAGDPSGNIVYSPSDSTFYLLEITESPALEVNVPFDSIQVVSGRSYTVPTRVINNGQEDLIFDTWITVDSIDDSEIRRNGVLDQPIMAGEELLLQVSYSIPGKLEPGSYQVRFVAGSYPILVEDFQAVWVDVIDE